MQGFPAAPILDGPLTPVLPERLRRVWRIAALIGLGGFLFGYGTGVVSGALLFVTQDFHLNSFQQGSVVSVLLLGAMAGALGAGRIADRLGRRTTLGVEGAVFVSGTAIAVVLSVGYWTLIAALLVLGLAVGAASATVPVYLSEVAPTEIRGRVLTLNQLMITIGILVAYVVDLAFSSSADWRAMFGIGAIPAVAMTAAALWLLPESPHWLNTHPRVDAARQPIGSTTNEPTTDELITRRRLGSSVRPALTVGLTLAVLQQFAGINTIIYYAPTIIHRTGLSAANSISYSIAIGVINLVMTLAAVRLIDRAGRRRLLLLSLTGMLITLLLLGLSFVAGWSSLLSLVFMVLYIAAFAVGMGPIFWVLIAEIFPASARAAGASASTAANWTANLLVSLGFLPVVHAIGQGQTFWIFAVVCAFALWFVGRYLPETRDRDVDQIDAALQARFGRRPPTGSTAAYRRPPSTAIRPPANTLPVHHARQRAGRSAAPQPERSTRERMTRPRLPATAGRPSGSGRGRCRRRSNGPPTATAAAPTGRPGDAGDVTHTVES